MSIFVATWIVHLVSVYLMAGLVVALAIVARGLGRLDPVAAHGTWGFRLLILPGLTALWPLMLLRVLRGLGLPPTERNAHRDAAKRDANP